MIRTSFLTVLLMICTHPCSLDARLFAAEETPTKKLTYEQHIRPIFRAHCFDCHGATAELEGGLDLRLVRLMKAGGDSGAAIVPGDPEESLLLQRVLVGEMPPGDHNVPAQETAIIKQWISAGAPTSRAEPDSIGPGLGITPEERAYWAFQPLTKADAPSAAEHPRIRNPIDSIVLQSLAGQETAFEPEADRTTLVIRLYFDLIGLPPSAEEIRRWCRDSRVDWYDHLINQLLESPHYGERWARHWLDVAGYADSEGYTVGDQERAWAWKYRDWVIRALNNDTPFDQFIIAQLAGDELAGPRDGDLTDEQIELLTATGFLRMAADGTGNGANNDEARNQVMIDTIKIVGTSLMGFSFHCAQCHDHRYDPILQTDYYALRAVFEPSLDWKAWKTPGARLVSLYTAADRERAAEVEVEAKKIEQERNERQAEYMQQALDKELLNYDEPLRTSLRLAYQTAAKERTDEQNKLLAANPSVNITPGNLYQYIPDSKPQLAEISKRIAEVRTKKPAEAFLRALVEPAGHVPETKLFHRGDPGQPKQAIAPAAPEVASPEGQQVEFPINDPAIASTGRRLAFARWLTDRDNPLLARVIVNRVWMHHFGKGLVATPGEFGKLGATPSDPQLLDWLAAEFIEQGWSLKRLHRLIVSSTLWRQRVVPTSTNPYARTLRRLEAETIRDRILVASGSLDRQLFGPPVNIKEDETGQVVVDGPQSRRSLYIQARRSRPVALLQTFDAPVMETNCENRVSSTVATQSLMLLNGQFILDQSAKLADRAARESQPMSTDGLPGQIVRAWELAYNRPPRADELAMAVEFIGNQIRTMEAMPAAVPPGRTSVTQAMTNLCQTLLSSNEFLYVE